MAVAVERFGVCAACGETFADRSRTSPRSYCYECRPVESAKVTSAPPAESIGEPFTVEHFRAWSTRFKLKDGSEFVLEEFEAAFLEDVFARDDAGGPVFSELWLLVPEGNGKTTFIALLVLYVIEFKPEAWVPVAASARDQAVDLTYRIASGFVVRNKLEDEYRLHPGYRQIVHRESLGSAKIFASDAASGDGVDPTLAVIEELHRLKSMELYRTWSGKLDKSGGQLVIVSTAGEPGSEFEDLRDQIRKSATVNEAETCFLRAEAPGVVLHEWALPVDGDSDDLELVAAANPFSGKTLKVLARRNRSKPSWTRSHWRRFVCNLAETTSGEVFIPGEKWALLADLEMEIEERAAACLGADGSRTFDTTVVAWASLDGEKVRVAARVFSVRAEVAHHVLHDGGRIDFDDGRSVPLGPVRLPRRDVLQLRPAIPERSADIMDKRLPASCLVAVEPWSKADA